MRSHHSSRTPGLRAHGMALAYMIIGTTVILGVTTFAVDLGYISITKSELQASVDAACLAGASGVPYSAFEARTRAKSIALSNKVNGTGLNLQDSDIEMGTWNATSKTFTVLTGSAEANATAVRVTGRLSKARGNALNLIFAPVLGFKNKELTVSAIAGFAQAADVVVVQDITASFSAELSDAKVGDQALLDSLYQGGAGKSAFGLVAFTGWGKTMSPLKTINANYPALTSSISGLNLCGSGGMPACSGTDIASGIEQAISVFNDPAYPSTSPNGKAMVIVSDGEPSQSSTGSHPALNDSLLLKLAQDDADDAWAQKIHIYVVFFNATNDPNAAQKLASLTRGKGDFVQVSDAKQLPVALADITKKLPMSLVR